MKRFSHFFLVVLLLAAVGCQSPPSVTTPEMQQTVMSQTELIRAAIPKVEAQEFTLAETVALLQADLRSWEAVDRYFNPTDYPE